MEKYFHLSDVLSQLFKIKNKCSMQQLNPKHYKKAPIVFDRSNNSGKKIININHSTINTLFAMFRI